MPQLPKSIKSAMCQMQHSSLFDTTKKKLCFLIVLSFDLNCIFNKYAYCLAWLKKCSSNKINVVISHCQTRRLKNLKSIRLVQSKKEIDGKAQCISFQVLSDLFSSNATTDPNG
ncbi:ubiquitin-conjugating enzyme E22 [Trichinella spiralis]|uniref:ubiquitin-conjugating enzyme E22 n=1 Tax=Trichinella spiralis TaxID=6334 RepID=UPI0001EFEF29|nr:ubiquitin-conjugating enzyme E22 [Trichinella spiralis]